MFPINHLLSLTPNRISAAVNRLQRGIWCDLSPLQVEATAAQERFIALGEAKKSKRRRVNAGESWGKLFDQRWCRIALPKLPARTSWFLNWRDQGEATLYVDGVPYFGFDVAHRHCRLPAGAKELWLECTCIQSAIWHQDATGISDGGSRFDGAFLCRRDDVAWHAYHDLKCLFDIMLDERRRENPLLAPALNAFGEQAPLDSVSPFYRRLLRLLDNAVNAFDQHGAAALSHSLSMAYAELRQSKTFQRCVLTGHAHVDLVWLWPERIGELKAVHVFATANRLLEEYPEFKFGYSQPASYEAVSRRAPALYRNVQNRIKRGCWQATGAMYVESDTLIATGEALVRSFMLGQEGFRQISGKTSRLTWLPDVFGYSGSLPQMMKLSNVDYFFTTKMTWNAVNRFPYSSFVWRGIDGSEIVAHVMQGSNYVTHMNIGDVKNALYGHQQADIHGEFLLPVGYGDGGGGPTDEMCERARRLGSLPGMPSLVWDQPENFFDRLAKLRDKLPVHQGECYLEYHRGTYTTHGNLKDAFRNLERALQIREAAAVATGNGGVPAEAWKRMVFAQFHDYIPGSSIHEVYAEGLPELNRIANEQLAAAKKALTTKGGDSVFNPLPVAVKRWLKPNVLVEIPPLTGALIKHLQITTNDEVTVGTGGLSNHAVQLRVNKAGAINSLVIDGRKIAIAEPLGMFALYPDRPANFEAWDVDRQALALGRICNAPAEITASREGKSCAAINVTRKLGKASSATLTYRLQAESKVVQIEVVLDWQEPEHLLKLNFPTKYAATNARFGIPYGSVLRPQLPGAMQSEAMWEVPFSRWLAVFEEGEQDGLFLITEDKYGATVRSGEIGVSLVRSPRVTGFDSHSNVRPANLARLKPSSIYSDIGRHIIRLAIGRYDTTNELAQQPAALADALFTPPLTYQGKPVQTAYQGVEADGNLIPAWAMPDGKGAWILRLNEIAGRRGAAKLRLAKGTRVEAVNLLGQLLAAKKVVNGKFDYDPYEIISLRIKGGGI
jgi:alpha-mannosidase